MCGIHIEWQHQHHVFFLQGGWQDPQKVIGFDYFVQENAIFFLISLKVGGRGQDKLGGAFPPSLAHPWHHH